ncbi:hypothetical protein EX895_004548 [Sporisorium graminicola]|uniref:Uncharacterized protein n=1 Tax=Sporisorium graminicola TaxID=280036 RepID=A0A4V6ETF3_9BASI|nr:hypothetical protein EX895_004548 [Sporisorium graminicola]TKY86399.1 hypothetical protein EX895_004548 [Sporisorium graminicola]
MVQDYIASSPVPAKPALAASYQFAASSAESQPIMQRAYERTPTSPSTPTFVLPESNPFGGEQLEAKSSERTLLGGWMRGIGSQAKGAKPRPSLHRPSTMLSDDTKTDVASLASHADEDGLRTRKTSPTAFGAMSNRSLLGLPSLRYMLYTRKGRRDVATHLRAWTSPKSILMLVLLLLISVRILLAPTAPVDVDVNGRIASHKASEAVFLNHWIDHVIHHPVRARDKAGFAEMGLRTEMYSHMLHHPTLPNFDRMERALWPFVPGINQLRRWWQASVQAKPMQYSSASGSKLVSRAFGRGPTIKPGSRGIVMSLGKKGSVFASQFISIIREKHHNDIPVELYYYGDSDLPPKYRDYLTKAHRNVRCIDLQALGLFDPELVQLERQGFAIKPFAVLATNFTEVMLADADAIMLEDPNHFFEEPGYLDTGTLFFHDRDHVRKGADYVVQEFMNNQLGQRGPSPRLASSEFWKKKGIFEQESGIVVVDKRKTDVFAALLFTAWQNMGDIRKKTTYRVWWGDKESFWLAFELSQFPYYFVPRYAQAIGTTKMVTRAEKLKRAAKAKAKVEKAKAEEKAKKAGAAKKIVKRDAAKVVEFDEAGDVIPAAKVEKNPFKQGVQPGETKPKLDDKTLKDANPSESDLEEEEEFCSEHPLHFLGADKEDHDGDGVLDTMTLGRPAWFNGGILDVKTLSDDVYINPNAFTLDGAWEFLFDEETWCIRNYTKGDINQFDLSERIQEFSAIAKRAEDKFRAKIPKPPKKKSKKDK